MNFLDTSLGLATRVRAFSRGLCVVLGDFAAQNRSYWPQVSRIYFRISRRCTRLRVLLAQFEAGTLPPPRPPRARAKPAGEKSARAPDLVPRRWGYLLELGKDRAASYGRILTLLVADPQMVALLKASPQACRLIRPTWHMLAPGPLPEVLRLPPRPKRAPSPEPEAAAAAAQSPVQAAVAFLAQASWRAACAGARRVASGERPADSGVGLCGLRTPISLRIRNVRRSCLCLADLIRRTSRVPYSACAVSVAQPDRAQDS